ncbi:MAG TPA: hypothetical protein VG452_08170 [Egibacteraceae bacterium]|nr:hypothetical protein [Egibacteraceae bacterium]
MSARSEYDAAYFTLLRAIEERDALLGYRTYLETELQRLDGFAEQTRELAEPVPAKVRRPVEQTTKPLLEAVGQRRATVFVELGRVEQRVANAEAFVQECEAEVAALRR